MKKIIKLSTFIHNSAYETDIKNAEEMLFNRNTYEFEHKIKVLEELNIAEEDFVCWDFDYIPLFDLSYADTQRDYLITSCRKDSERILKMHLNDIELEFYFRKELEFSELRAFWWQHYKRVVKQKAIEWCQDYNIPYEDNMPKIKPLKMTYVPERE